MLISICRHLPVLSLCSHKSVWFVFWCANWNLSGPTCSRFKIPLEQMAGYFFCFLTQVSKSTHGDSERHQHFNENSLGSQRWLCYALAAATLSVFIVRSASNCFPKYSLRNERNKHVMKMPQGSDAWFNGKTFVSRARNKKQKAVYASQRKGLARGERCVLMTHWSRDVGGGSLAVGCGGLVVVVGGGGFPMTMTRMTTTSTWLY